MSIFIVFVLGLAIGSFLNVCIYRISHNLSIIKPSSFCPSCRKTIAFYDNIPVISYFLLGGKCRHCGSKISLRYPLVELITAVDTCLLFIKWMREPYWLGAVLILSYIFIVIAAMDLETFMIADLFSYLIVLIGLVFFWANPYFKGGTVSKFLQFFGGLIAGAFIMWFMSFLGKKIYKKDAIGEGDIFLMAAIGSVLGIEGVFSTIILASLFGSVYAVSLMIMKKAGRRDYIPFGPFLSLGAVINLYSFVKISTFFI